MIIRLIIKNRQKNGPIEIEHQIMYQLLIQLKKFAIWRIIKGPTRRK